MNELNIYGKDGLFHSIVKKSKVMAGRYVVLPKGMYQLNAGNMLSGLDLPENGKFPLVACLAPASEIESTKELAWETFSFRLLFLCTSKRTGDGQIKNIDPLTNLSMQDTVEDWSDMKRCALNFMHALHSINPKTRGQFRVNSDPAKIMRLVETTNHSLNGILLSFNAAVASTCTHTDIPASDYSSIVIPNNSEQPVNYH